MNKTTLLLAPLLLLSSLYAGKGKIRVASDKQGAYVYVDGKKKAMTGEGFTSILLEEGDHNVKVEYVYPSGLRVLRKEKNIFVGEDSSIKLRFKLINSGTFLTEKGKALEKQKKLKRSKDEEDGRWENKDNVLIDHKLGLMWQDEPYTKQENEAYYDNFNYGKVGFWKYAKNFCNKLSLNEYNDWYLPSIDQFKYLYEYSDKIINLTTEKYISSTSDTKNINHRIRINGNKSHAIGISAVSITNSDASSYVVSYIRCVRDIH